ncbi:MAG: hypothetical protein DRO15_03965 [Thermoprotei archaeon]|nr:MAG: hypothetical protein DRO15_03965 [Thermoprotei archaeon]
MRKNRSTIAIIGSFTIDNIENRKVIGGSAYYCLMALKHFYDDQIMLIAPAQRVHIDLLKDMGIKLITVSNEVPVFELVYIDEINRKVKLLKKGAVIKVDSEVLSMLRNSLAIISPVYKEVSLETIYDIRSVATTLALDIQGFVREANNYGEIIIRWNNELVQALRIVDIVHADLSEVPMYRSALSAVKFLSKYSKGIVIVSMGAHGLIASFNQEIMYIPALPGIQGDATGTGDILLSIAAYEFYKGEDWKRAIAKGAAAAGLRVSRGRIPWFNYYEIEVLSDNLISKSKVLR